MKIKHLVQLYKLLKSLFGLFRVVLSLGGGVSNVPITRLLIPAELGHELGKKIPQSKICQVPYLSCQCMSVALLRQA